MQWSEKLGYDILSVKRRRRDSEDRDEELAGTCPEYLRRPCDMDIDEVQIFS